MVFLMTRITSLNFSPVKKIFQLTANQLIKKLFVNSEGFEPPTSWAVTRCTIQLCYESSSSAVALEKADHLSSKLQQQ